MLRPTTATHWLALKQPSWAPKTYSAASLDVCHLKKHFGGMLLTDVTATDVSEELAYPFADATVM